jgi:hypothetical protein
MPALITVHIATMKSKQISLFSITYSQPHQAIPPPPSHPPCMLQGLEDLLHSSFAATLAYSSTVGRGLWIRRLADGTTAVEVPLEVDGGAC